MSLYSSSFLLRILFSLEPECISFNLLWDNKLHTFKKNVTIALPFVPLLFCVHFLGEKWRIVKQMLQRKECYVLDLFFQELWKIPFLLEVLHIFASCGARLIFPHRVRRIAKSKHQFRNVCPSASVPAPYSHELTRLQQKGFSWYLKLDFFFNLTMNLEFY